MSKYVATDPELLGTFTTDARGRLNLGEKYADKKVKVCVIESEPKDE